MGIFFLYYLFMAVRSQAPEYLYEKLEGGIFSTTVIVLLASWLVSRMSAILLIQRLLEFGVIVLICTVVYKIGAGFWDRSVRFFINGPIVFGWIMGSFSIVAGALAILGQNTKRNRALMFIFMGAAIWPLSRGPLLAMVVGQVLLHTRYMLRRSALVSLSIALALGLIVGRFFPVEILGRIYFFMERLAGSGIDGEVADNLRILMWHEALGVWKDHPIFGIGPSNYSIVTQFEGFRYPHNLVLETLAEVGLFGFALLLVAMAWIFSRSSSVGQIIIVFFFICTSFSGDLSYLRMIIVFPAILISMDDKLKRRTDAAEV